MMLQIFSLIFVLLDLCDVININRSKLLVKMTSEHFVCITSQSIFVNTGQGKCKCPLLDSETG